MKNFNRPPQSPLSWGLFFLFAGLTGLFAFNGFESKDQKTVSLAADKMNVLFIGVENPLTVAVEGVDDDKVALASDEVQLTKTGQGRYAVVAKTPGNVSILVHGEGFEPRTLIFRVKQLPDPVATLENPNLYFKTEGTVLAGKFKESVGLALFMGGCFDYEADLQVAEFSIVRVHKRSDPVQVICPQGNFNERAKKLVDEAAPGDTYYFENVKVKMQGEEDMRKVNSLVFRIM